MVLLFLLARDRFTKASHLLLQIPSQRAHSANSVAGTGSKVVEKGSKVAYGMAETGSKVVQGAAEKSSKAMAAAPAKASAVAQGVVARGAKTKACWR